MAHWLVPRLRGLHPSMTKCDGALRSGCCRSTRTRELTLTATKLAFALEVGSAVKVGGLFGIGRSRWLVAVWRCERPVPASAADPIRPCGDLWELQLRTLAIGHRLPPRLKRALADLVVAVMCLPILSNRQYAHASVLM